MSSCLRRLVPALALFTLVVAVPQRAGAQAEVQNNFKYNSGQDVQPIFEGWSKNPDGSFNMHFGYLNRNYVEEPAIPVGPANSIEPGGPDRGQPTYFYPRTNRNLFKVMVPKDWGKKELIWTVTVNGKTQKAFGWLQPEWEIDPAGGAQTGGRTDKEFLANKPPSIVIKPASAASVSDAVTLVANVTDDGLPKPAPQRKPAIGQETPPTLQGGADAPVNVPSVAGNTRGGGGGRGGVQGPTVTWMVWRGPAGATFEPRAALVKDGVAQTTAVFTKPGEYVIRGRASDRFLTTDGDVRITVR
jgi:hypothetical protein